MLLSYVQRSEMLQNLLLRVVFSKHYFTVVPPLFFLYQSVRMLPPDGTFSTKNTIKSVEILHGEATALIKR